MLLSCSRPGRIAAKVSPVEATKYTEVVQTRKKRRRYYQATQNDSGRWVLTPQGYLVSNDIISDLLLAQDNSVPLKRI